MDAGMLHVLAGLPRLSRPGTPALACKICGGSAPLFDVVDFNKVCSTTEPYAFGLAGLPIAYHRCGACGFLFTGALDTWSEADFARFVYNDDYVLVDGDYVENRPRGDARMVAAMLDAHRGALRVLDYGGGRGLLAAALREAGYDAESYDPFASPARPNGRFDVITCFEVIEHSVDPVASMREMRGFLADDGCILIGTGIQPPDIGMIRANWWYVGPRNGHVSMHTVESLARLGLSSGLVLRNGGGLNGFATATPSPRSRAILDLVGPPVLTLDLVAPGLDHAPGPLRGDPYPWHGVEGANPSFRWTSSDEVGWTWSAPPIGATTVRIRLGYVNEIEPGFADRSTLSIDGVPVPLVRDGTMLSAEISIDLVGPRRILLRTPPPRIPLELYGTLDDRRLGIAVTTRI